MKPVSFHGSAAGRPQCNFVVCRPIGPGLCPGDHAFAGFVLSLLEIEDCHTVRVREIVGRGYGLDGVGFIADVVARNPLAGPAGGLAVTEVQSVRLERSVIGLAAPR
jgi:hypothetical protein